MHAGRDKAVKTHTVFERLQLGILHQHASALCEGVLTTPLYPYRLPLIASVSSTISVFEHEFMHRTED